VGLISCLCTRAGSIDVCNERWKDVRHETVVRLLHLLVVLSLEGCGVGVGVIY
jgi:hypothetical protein